MTVIRSVLRLESAIQDAIKDGALDQEDVKKTSEATKKRVQTAWVEVDWEGSTVECPRHPGRKLTRPHLLSDHLGSFHVLEDPSNTTARSQGGRAQNTGKPTSVSRSGHKAQKPGNPRDTPGS